LSSYFARFNRFADIIRRIGFSDNPVPGEIILPSGSFGTISSFNAHGKSIIHKDKPMETAYRTIEWHWRQWEGRYDTSDHSKFVDVSYKRYPRTFVNPLGIELRFVRNKDNHEFVTGPIFDMADLNKANLLHSINLFLEIFHECQFFTENLDIISKTPLIRLNWKILPPGIMPWEHLKRELQPILRKIKEGNRPFAYYRLETIEKANPEFSAIGEGGFLGYIVFGFSKKGIYILENVLYGNATYIFDEKWEELSKLTKAQILYGSLHKDRIIHSIRWSSAIKKWLE